jgi:hypothetical protein
MLMTGIAGAQTSEKPANSDNTRPIPNTIHAGEVEIGITAGRSLGDVGGAFVNLPGTITYRISAKGSASGMVFAGAALTDHIIAMAEASFLNGSHGSSDLGGGNIAETYTRAVIYDVAGEYRFLIRSRKWVPYAGLGIGTDQSRSDVLVRFTGTPTSTPVLAAATQVRLREAAFAPLFVAGLQGFLGHRYGFRVEGRGFLPTGSSHDPIGEVTAGVFLAFH